MTSRLIPLILLLFIGYIGNAQTPQNISLGSASGQSLNPKMVACQDQFAGTISFNNFVGQSNDIDLDTIYFCFGDQIDIVHNGDSDLTGDPDLTTTAGITYGFFNCPPTISGPDLATILTDGCIIDNPVPTEGIWVSAGGNSNGNITFSNDGTLQNFFNNDMPVLIWFAPITVDDFGDKEYEEEVPGDMNPGPCTNLNVDQAFAVVYLNEIQATNMDNNTGLNGCQGRFDIEGGLSEFDNSNYDISISLVTDPNVTGTVENNGGVSHGETVTFNVPQPGIYSVVVSDGKSCEESFLMDMSACTSMTLTIGSATVATNQSFCLDVTTGDGFVDIAAMQMSFNWDESVLSFDNVQSFNPNLPNLGQANFSTVGNNALIFSWDDFGFGNSLPEDLTLFQICFTSVGNFGDCSDVSFSSSPSPIEIGIDNNGNLETIGFNGVDGSVCLTNNNLVLDFTQDSVSCFGFSDGAFTVNVNGGMEPYEIQWQDVNGGPLQGPISFGAGTYTSPNTLAGASYSVTITDATMGNPLTIVDTVAVLEDPELELIFNENEPLCNGDSGTIQVILGINNNPVMDVSDYDFEWSNGDSTQTTGLVGAGLYSVTVTDIKGCQTSGSTFLFDPPQISLDISITNATCPGIDNGAISIVVNGGTPDINGDYSIKWTTIGGPGGLLFTNNVSNVSGLAYGCYPLCITDDNGCVLNTEICVPADKIIDVNVDVDSVLCNGENSGSIFATGFTTGDVPSLPYTFAWFGTPNPPPPANTPTTTLLSNLAIGTYTLVMQDQAGCEIDTTFMVFQPEVLTANLLSVNPESCDPGGDGGFVMEVLGGTYPYTYDWGDGVTMDSMPSNLIGGMYDVTVADANNCFVVVPVVIGNPAPPTIVELLDDQIDCSGGMTGELEVIASGNISSYTWSNTDTGSVISNLAEGEYIVTVTAADGCTAVDTAIVTAPLPLTQDSINTVLPVCPGLGGGEISVFVSGGTGPYFYDWEPLNFDGVGNATAAGGSVVAGDYTIIITDANNCPSLTVNATLDDPAGIEISFDPFSIDSVSCLSSVGFCDGGATASAQYEDGTTGLFNFFWVSNEQDNDVMSSTASQLCAGPQTVVVSDANCVDSAIVVIPAPDSLGFSSVDVNNVSCNGSTDGSITITPSGGTMPYEINWSTGDMGTTVTDLAPGNYLAVIEDNNGCTFTVQTTVNEPDPFILLTGDATSTTCNGGDDGTYMAVWQGGTGQPVFTWENGIGSPNDPIATNLAAGVYSVTATDLGGCQDSINFVITEPAPIQFQLAAFEPILCNGDLTTLTVESVTGGNPGLYQFSVDDFPALNIGLPQQVFAGEHTITVFESNNESCFADTTFVINQPAPLSVSLPSFVEVELGDTLYQLNPDIDNSLPIDSFLWSPSNGLLCPGAMPGDLNCPNPYVNITQLENYTLTVVDINGCTASASIEVDVDANRNVFIPNIFSPNDDGRNDVFRVYTGLGVQNINFIRIYNRWGDFVYEMDNVAPDPNGTVGWDGRFNGERMNPGVFLYMIEVQFLDGQILLYRGDVTLIR